MTKFFTWYLDHSRFLGILWGILAILLAALTKSWIAFIGTLICSFLFFLGCDYLENKHSKAAESSSEYYR